MVNQTNKNTVNTENDQNVNQNNKLNFVETQEMGAIMDK